MKLVMHLLNYDDLLKKGIPYSRTHLWRMAKAGQFPKPINLGGNRIAWVEEEIDEWIIRKIKNRDEGE